MTREELKEHCKKQIEMCEMWAKAKGENPCGKVYEEHKMILELLEQDPCEDCVSRKDLLKIYEDRFLELQKIKRLKDNKGAEDRQMGVNYCINILKEMPPVTPQQKIRHCRDCKWWRDEDGVYRRGFVAESECPINHEEVYKGNGYCIMFEPKTPEVTE